MKDIFANRVIFGTIFFEPDGTDALIESVSRVAEIDENELNNTNEDYVIPDQFGGAILFDINAVRDLISEV